MEGKRKVPRQITKKHFPLVLHHKKTRLDKDTRKNITKIINAMYHNVKKASGDEERKNRMKRAMLELNDLVRLMSGKKYPGKERQKKKILKLLKIWENEYSAMFNEIFTEEYIEEGREEKMVGLRERVQHAGSLVGSVDILRRGNVYKMPVDKFPEIEAHIKNINKILVGNETELVYDDSKKITRSEVWKIADEIRKLVQVMKKNNFGSVPEKEKSQHKEYIVHQLNAMKLMALPGDISDIFDFEGLQDSFKNAG